MLIIDAFAFCRLGEKKAGKLLLSELGRLRAECVSDEGEIEWTIAGKTSTSGRIAGYPVLHLTVSGKVQLRCQRCMSPTIFQIKSTSMLLLARDERNADQLEELLEADLAQVESESDAQEEVTEVVAGSKEFDVIALIEDEALLALPLSPRHEVCPGDVKFDGLENVKKESPFSVLKDQLKIKN